MRFSGHESFACRYAWLPKGYRAISEAPGIFSNIDEAMVRLGVGKNMVRSIRFWIEVMGIAEPLPDRTLQPTPFGRNILADDGFDPFLEDRRTLWLLHWKIASRADDPLFAWDFLLNRWPYPEFSRTEALRALLRESRRMNLSHSEVTLGQHLDVFLRTYLPSSAARGEIEDMLDCPLAGLEMLEVVGERRIDGSGRRESVFAFRRAAKYEITRAVFEYCLDEYWNARHPGDAVLTFRDVAIAPGSVGQVFKLPEDDIRARLDTLAAPKTKNGSFAYQPSAVQGLVSRRPSENGDLLPAIFAEGP